MLDLLPLTPIAFPFTVLLPFLFSETVFSHKGSQCRQLWFNLMQKVSHSLMKAEANGNSTMRDRRCQTECTARNYCLSVVWLCHLLELQQMSLQSLHLILNCVLKSVVTLMWQWRWPFDILGLKFYHFVISGYAQLIFPSERSGDTLDILEFTVKPPQMY